MTTDNTRCEGRRGRNAVGERDAVATDGGTNEPRRSDGEADDSGAGGVPIGRRALLGGGLAGGVGLAAGAYLLVSSSDDPVDGDDGEDGEDGDDDEEEPTVPDDHVPFSVWSEQLDAVRTSPDHLPARAERLVEDADVEAIFAFVRDEIATVPTDVDGFDDVMSTLRWGPRGALRSGTGTPRDKAELLASLYREAGYESEVLEANETPIRFGLNVTETMMDLFLRSIDREYDPEVDEETIADWRDRLGTDESTTIEFADEDGTESEALAGTVLKSLPDDAASDGRWFNWRWDGARRTSSASMPIVSVTDDDGDRRYANLFLDVPFDRVHPDDDLEDEVRDGLEPAGEPDPQTVRVELSAATPSDLLEGGTFELVSGEWPVPELIGRQLRVRHAPIDDPFEFPEISVNDVDSFIPAIGVQGSDVGEEDLAELSEFGDLVTLTGLRLSAEHEIDDGEMVVDETVTRDGEPFYDPAEAGDPATVSSIDVTADSTDYPRIGLEATPTDADGTVVDGLVGSTFGVRDEGEAVAPTMVRSAPNPRVLLVRDDSASMDSGPLDDLPLDDAWYDELGAAIREAIPTAEIEVQAKDSQIWTHLTEAVVDSDTGDGYDLIVYAHDGIAKDDLTASMERILEDAPPTVLISAHDVDEPVESETILEQAELLGATAVPMGETELVEGAILDELQKFDAQYRFEYHVPDREPGERSVELTVGEDPADDPIARAEATYTADPSQADAATSLVGLYLTVEVDGRSVTRTLAGWDPRERGTLDPQEVLADPESDVDPAELSAAAEDVRNAVFGGVDLAFEGDGVPYAVAADDFLSANLTRERLGVASIEEEYEGQLEVLNEGYAEIPWDLLQVMAPLPNAVSEDGITFFDAPRIVLSQVKPEIFPIGDEIGVEETMDVLPLARCATAGTGTEAEFELTLERTASIAVAERAAYDVSTAILLEGLELAELGDVRSDFDAERAAAFDTLRELAGVSDDDHQLVAEDGSELAFWNVDEETGALLGVLDDGTGGARRIKSVAFQSDEDIDRFNKVVSKLIELLEKKGALSSMGATSLGVVADYYAELAKLYAQVAGLLAGINDATSGELENDLDEELKEMIKELVKNFAEEHADI